MVKHVGLTHRTTYRYDRPVALGPHILRLRPAPHCRSRVLAYALNVEPRGHLLYWQQDPHGNHLARLVFQEPAQALEVAVDLLVDMTVINPFDFLVEPHAAAFPFAYEDWLQKELQPFLNRPPAGPHLAAWLATVDRGAGETVPLLVELNRRLHIDLTYGVRLEPGIQDPEQTLALQCGSCRDSAWLLTLACRHLGLAARFVSGYLIQLVPDEVPLEGPAGVTVDSADLHAWTEVYLPGAGWIGFDPTSGLLAGEGHIPLAATPDPQSAAAVSGTNVPAGVDFSFAFEVRRIAETPSTARPYEDEAWASLEACGRRIDAALADAGLILPMSTRLVFVPGAEGARPDPAESAAGESAAAVADTAASPAAAAGPGPASGACTVDTAPAAEWPALAEALTAAHAAARQARLRAESFLSDGRAVPPGQSRVVLGGLARPDLVSSLVACWHDHPSLSYLFGGPVVGPAGPAPRCDEREVEAPHELALALAQLDAAGTEVTPDLVEAVLRPILVGTDGRGEFGFEVPAGAGPPVPGMPVPGMPVPGMPGTVVLNAFGMAAHPRLALARLLLVRALVARWARLPYRRRLVPWGPALHDRFLLPHFAWADLCEVLDDLAEAGTALDPDWFRPHFEARFPLCGTVERMGIRLEVRQALEAWPAMPGPAGSAGPAGPAGPAGIVPDVAMNRLQVLVRGPVQGRYAVLCNGRRLPLHGTGAPLEAIAGVRFKARHEPGGRHPGLPVTTRLVFEVVDLWSQRSVGGCTHHVGHPAGYGFAGSPVNACEAESRRHSRFADTGHTPGRVALPALAPDSGGAVTVDLRVPAPGTASPASHPRHRPGQEP